MKVLLDENIDVRFKQYFPDGYEVYTVKVMHWNGINSIVQFLLMLTKIDLTLRLW